VGVWVGSGAEGCNQGGGFRPAAPCIPLSMAMRPGMGGPQGQGGGPPMGGPPGMPQGGGYRPPPHMAGRPSAPLHAGAMGASTDGSQPLNKAQRLDGPPGPALGTPQRTGGWRGAWRVHPAPSPHLHGYGRPGSRDEAEDGAWLPGWPSRGYTAATWQWDTATPWQWYYRHQRGQGTCRRSGQGQGEGAAGRGQQGGIPAPPGVSPPPQRPRPPPPPPPRRACATSPGAPLQGNPGCAAAALATAAAATTVSSAAGAAGAGAAGAAESRAGARTAAADGSAAAPPASPLASRVPPLVHRGTPPHPGRSSRVRPWSAARSAAGHGPGGFPGQMPPQQRPPFGVPPPGQGPTSPACALGAPTRPKQYEQQQYGYEWGANIRCTARVPWRPTPSLASWRCAAGASALWGPYGGVKHGPRRDGRGAASRKGSCGQ